MSWKIRLFLISVDPYFLDKMESYQKSNVPFQQKADPNDPPIEIGIILSLVISKIQISFQSLRSMSSKESLFLN